MKHLSLVIISSFLVFASCTQTQAHTEYVLGTFCTINLFDQGTEDKYNVLFSRLREIDRVLSANSDTSNVSEINNASGLYPVKALPDTMKVINTAIYYSEKTEGAFDLTIGPLVKAWNIGFDNANVPEKTIIDQSLDLIDYRNVVVDVEEGTVFLRKKGMKIDFGAIAKGYAADELVALLKKMKVKRGIIDLGGNIYAFGDKGQNKPWIVGIRDPFNESSRPIASIPVTNGTVVTSGVYERFFEFESKKYHHILDTKTGYPVDNELLSVSIISTSSILADTLSTSVFALGSKRGKALIESLQGTEAILIFKDRHIETTGAVHESLTLLSDQFSIIQ